MSRPGRPVDTLAKALGGYVRQLREQQGCTQAALAQAAQAEGLPWSRNLIPSIEAGKRRIDLDEFLRLPEVLARLGIKGLELADLLPAEIVTPWRTARYQALQAMALRHWAKEEERLWRRILGRAPQYPHVVDDRLIEPPEPKPRDIELAAETPAVLQAAARLRCHPKAVSLASWKLWKKTFEAERDRRLGEVPASASRASSLGHVSRNMIEELKSLLRKRRARSTERRPS